MNPSIVLVATVVFGLICGTAGIAPVVSAADKHPFNTDDYSAMHRARAVAISPDGNSILYQVLYDGTSGPVNKHDWHLMDASGENARKLDLPEHFEPSGFTKDGRALYGTAPVGQLTQPAIISPDGTRFAVLADPRKKDPLAQVHTVAENDETSLYVVDASGTGGGWWCPTLKDITDIAWSADGSRIAVITQWQKLGHHELHSFVDVCSAGGTRRVAEIPNGTSGIAWAQGGQELVFASTNTPVLTPEHIWTVPVSGGPAVDRTPNLLGTAVSVAGDPRGTVWVEMHKGVFSEVDTYRAGKLEPAYRWPDGVVVGLPVAAAIASAPAVLAFNVSDPYHADNIAVIRGAELRKITHEGDDTLANVNLGEAKVVQWT